MVLELAGSKPVFFGVESNKHGFGGYIGIVGSKRKHLDNKPAYGIGVGYHYFFNGIKDSGTNLGFSFTTDGSDARSTVQFQIGYQF